MKRAEDLSVCVMGLGYVGLPTAALLASRGIHVHGVDIHQDVADTINQGRVHIVEPDLDMLVRAASESKRLRASLEAAEADVFIIAVPTPSIKEAGKAHPSPCIGHVVDAVKTIAPHVRPGNLVILESTSPVGTTERIARVLCESGVDVDGIHLAYCPERVLPGRVIVELVENDRIVGGLTPASAAAAKEFYRIFVTGEIHETTCRAAEMAKLTENAFRDVNIAFANELSIICDKLGIDVFELIRLANRHPRVNILTPGCGVGGHCIAVDPWFIVDSDPENARLIRTAREVNDYKSLWVLERIKSEYRALKKDKPVVAICGLTFKPGIDDLRASPASKIAEELAKEEDAEFLFVEPNIKAHTDFTLTPWAEAVARADLVVKLVNHAAFGDGTLEASKKASLDFSCH